MSAIIIDGKKIASQKQKQLAVKISERLQKGQRAPSLAAVLLGENPASRAYIERKKIACREVGITTWVHELPEKTGEEELVALLERLNNNVEVDGILLQMPLPKHINAEHILDCIRPDKDVDGFHPYNLGRLASGDPLLRPCTAKGIMTLLTHFDIPALAGMEAVIIGASNLVGKPIALELLNANATVSVCHIYTHDISTHIKKADLLVVAAGVPELVKGSWIKEGAIVVDVGINRFPDGKILGDVEFEEAKKHAGWITPVPGGVGPMTVATLLENTFSAATLK
jgi:methylenetetrahydrofolate dehydrogenase (NADP+) / methenyltetrahydrofolate cyclohydrolase